MLNKIRNSIFSKGTSLILIFCILFELFIPTQLLALSGGPAQPEFGSFTPIGATDMVDLASGDMNYNLPLLDVGGYPINISYNSNIGMDDEASWVGLGWNLSVGQINRNVRGIPDDFKGDEMVYENYMKPNLTVGANFSGNAYLVGLDFIGLSAGISATYNNYNGFGMKRSVGMTIDLGSVASVGFNAESSEDGLTISPSLSIHQKNGNKNLNNSKLGGSIGAAFNTRQGLSSMSLSMTSKSVYQSERQKASNNGAKNYSGAIGSSISLVNNVYTPTKRVGMSTQSFTYNAGVGGEFVGGEGQLQVTGYGTIQKIKDEEKNKHVSAYGYHNAEKSNQESIMDFNREKDGSFSVNSNNLPLTNLTYDIYSIQGQGVSGMYRPYRGSVAFVGDTYISDESLSGSLGIEVGLGNLAHVGVDYDVTTVQSYSGIWSDDNGMIKKNKTALPSGISESVYYKNVGDMSADSENDFNFDDPNSNIYASSLFYETGNYSPIRIGIVGAKLKRKLRNFYTIKNVANYSYSDVGSDNNYQRVKRKTRNQAIHNITFEELEKGVGNGPLVNRPNANITYPNGYKKHHIGEVQIMKADGSTYVYGLPAYNTKKVEATFAVDAAGDCKTGLVSYSPNLLNSPENLPNDKYFNRVTTPGYAHTYLLTSVFSADYADRKGDGPTPDDFGTYTLFKYEKTNPSYTWRVPIGKNQPGEYQASYNEGLKTDSKDDQGNYVYGEKEQYYIKNIVTKTHIAIFDYSAREDALGVLSEAGGKSDLQRSFALNKISLFSIDQTNSSHDFGQNNFLNTNDLSSSTPIKMVHFKYKYTLCQGVPNITASNNEGGKLTLTEIYFTYKNSKMGKYNSYKFDYNDLDPNHNPDYNMKAFDSWGNYKPVNPNTTCDNYSPVVPNADFPYTEQIKTVQDENAQAWALTKIQLPSGGEIHFEYESDDYAYVQDKEVMRMYKIAGIGDNEQISIPTDIKPISSLYDGILPVNLKKYLYIKLNNEDIGDDNSLSNDLIKKYINENEKIYFRFYTNMTKAGGELTNYSSSSAINEAKFDYITGYLSYDNTDDDENNINDFPVKITSDTNSKYLAIPVKFETYHNSEETHPVSLAAWNFGRRYLKKHVYSDQPNGDTEDIAAIINDLVTPNTFQNLREVFKGPYIALKDKKIGKNIITERSWIRLKDSRGFKYGGGNRVKRVAISDNWEEMTGSTLYQTKEYGQLYSYILEDGKTSGVATFEPVGNKENPLIQPVFTTDKHLLAPDEENYIEKPFGESFFPNPQVTYSRVKVESISPETEDDQSPRYEASYNKLHKTGYTVSEFYTSKDFPVITNQTMIEPYNDERKLLDAILDLKVKKHFTASQGYSIHLNDMNGKEKATWVYAQGQNSPISGVRYLYKTNNNLNFTHLGKLNNSVFVISENGTFNRNKILGVDFDIVNDFRENATESITTGINTNLATFLLGIIPGIVPMPLPDYSQMNDQYRSATTTKVIQTFGILEETITYEDGASVSSKNLAWDEKTGEVLLTQTIDEYGDKVYNLNYPAHWYYKGMDQASKNLGFEGNIHNTTANIHNMPGFTANQVLIDGDELLINQDGVYKKVWIHKLQSTSFQLMDVDGNLIPSYNGWFKVIRSGHKNMQSANIMNITFMENPLNYNSLNELASINPDVWRIINAGAVDYSDYWKASCECDVTTASGIYNPYVQHERGMWRIKSSRTYLSGRKYSQNSTPRLDGFFSKFVPMYNYINNAWIKSTNNDWASVSEVTGFSPFGFEVENKDALNRFSSAQYGYNFSFPMAVASNSKYTELGFDGFEDYGFEGCKKNTHFSFDLGLDNFDNIVNIAHTGRNSIKVAPSSSIKMWKKINCNIKGKKINPSEENEFIEELKPIVE